MRSARLILGSFLLAVGPLSATPPAPPPPFEVYQSGDFGWLQALADQGNPTAQYGLAVAYQNGAGVPHDDVEAARWYSRCAAQGNLAAQYRMALAYENGVGVPQDDKRAAFWYEKCAAQGDAISQYEIGRKYLYGQGVKDNFNTALAWLRLAAQQGHAAAQYELGLNMVHHWEDLSKSEGHAWIEKSANKGYSKAVDYLAVSYMNSGLPLDRSNWLYRSAEQGYAYPQFLLGQIFEFEQRDLAKAFYWYEKSANQGYFKGENNLGELYAKGWGVARNDALAFYWYNQAANQRCAVAEYNVAVCYLEGRGVPRDLGQALRYYRRAAHGGYHPALAGYVAMLDLRYPGANFQRSFYAFLEKPSEWAELDKVACDTSRLAYALPWN